MFELGHKRFVRQAKFIIANTMNDDEYNQQTILHLAWNDQEERNQGSLFRNHVGGRRTNQTIAIIRT